VVAGRAASLSIADAYEKPKGISQPKPYLEEVFAECYSDAVEQASAETDYQ